MVSQGEGFLPLTLMTGSLSPKKGSDTPKLGGTIMTTITNRKITRVAAGFLVLALCVSTASAPALSQPFYRPGFGRPYVPPPPPRYHRMNDFDKTLAVIGTVGTIAAIANSRNNTYYYHSYPYRYPTVVVAPPRPALVVQTQPTPIVVEKQVIVEKPVVVERQVPVVISANGTYSPKLGASFRIENMQVPGYKFTAARLTSDPVSTSPLAKIGLRKGDVITRLDDSPANTLAELERHERNTLIRYIKTGTTKVLLANIYIPPTAEMSGKGTYYAP